MSSAIARPTSPTAGANAATNPRTSTLTLASQQWANRPSDERYGSIEDMHVAAVNLRSMAVTAKSKPLASLQLSAQGRDVIMAGGNGGVAKVSHWVFGQLAQKAEAPAAYLRTLPTELAVENLNHGLTRAINRDPKATTNLLLHRTEGHGGTPYLVRSMESDQYTRIWYSDLTARLVDLKHQGGGTGWQEAPAAFDGSRGQYLNWESMFSFFVDSDRRIFEKDPGGGLSRGFFLRNTEVAGKASLILDSFYYQYICGNHMVWGAQMASQLRLRHVGNADKRTFAELTVKLKRYAEAGEGEDRQRVTRAKAHILGANKEAVLDAVFGLGITGLTRKHIDAGYEKAVEHEQWYGDPRSAWGVVSGMTEVSRDMPYADERDAMDRAAGKVMEVAF